MSLFKKPQPQEATAQPPAAGTGTLADVLAPAAIKISPSFLQVGEKFSRTIFAATYPRYLSVSWFAPVINLDRVLDVSLYIQPAETGPVPTLVRARTAAAPSRALRMFIFVDLHIGTPSSLRDDVARAV